MTFRIGLHRWKAFLLASSLPTFAGPIEEVIKSFEKSAGYVEPIATLFGSMSNSGWYQSAGVSRHFGFYFGLPMSITQISDDDRSFSANHTDDGCVLYHQDSPSGNACQDVTDYTAPTVFGRKVGPTLKRTVYDPNAKQIVTTLDIPVSDGFSDVADFNWLPFVMPQLSFNYWHTEIKGRFITVPTDKFSFLTWGIGLQHDLASVLPPLPVSLSLAGNVSSIGAEFTPGENIDGKLELDGMSTFVGLLVGWNWKNRFETFAEIGWEKSSMEAGGDLTIHDEGGNIPDERITPSLSVDGRNGFRASLNLAIHFGYQAVLGQNMGANFGQQLSLLGMRYRKSN